MKTRRAQFHLDALEVVVKDWIDSKPYTITHYDDFEKAVHICRIASFGVQKLHLGTISAVQVWSVEGHLVARC